MPGSFKWSPSLRFLHQNSVYTSPLPQKWDGTDIAYLFAYINLLFT
jgi:hypothetical protein